MKINISLSGTTTTAALQNLITKYLKKTIYKNLEPLYKKPLITRWQEFYDVRGSEPELNTLVALYGQVPTKEFLKFLSHYPFYKEDHKTIEDWHQEYSQGETPLYKEQWAIMIWTEDDEPIEDGWHRLNSYLVAGSKYIPVVFCPEYYKVLEKL